VIAVSTLPEGVGLIRGLMTTAAISNHLAAEAAVYLPGAYAGIADFLVRQEAQDAKLLVVFAARADRLRWWVEQNAALEVRTSAGVHSLPMGAGVSAATAPLVKPYLDLRNARGWMVGFADAVTYTTWRRIPNQAFNRQVDALLVTHWVAGSLLLLGLSYYMISGRKGTV